jgi:hypothetical protein
VQAVGQHGLEAGQTLERRLAQALVGVDDAGLARVVALGVEDGCGDGRDLALEAALVDGHARLLLRGEPERLEVGPAEAAVVGDPVGRLELVGHVDRPVRRSRVAGAGGHVGAEGDAGHRLDPRGDADLDRAGGDHVVDHVGGLLPRAALGVDHGAAGVLRQPGVQPRAPHHAVGLLTGLGDTPGHDLLDELGVETGPREDLAHGVADENRGMHAGQPALPLAEGGADGVDDHWSAHETKLEHVLIRNKSRNLPSPTIGM